MSNYASGRVADEDRLSLSSDEKMDTGSESFRSQDTPNSIRSSDFDEKSIDHVLRLQDPHNSNPVLRLSEPETNQNKPLETETLIENYNKLSLNLDDLDSTDLKFPTDLNNSTKPVTDLKCPTDLSNSKLMNPPKTLGVTPLKSLGVSPPKYSSSLVLTTDHPLMGLGSPDDFPDLIPKSNDKESSFSSVEDDRVDRNGYGIYNPSINNSKNNLYFSDNFTTADSQILESFDQSLPPDVARVEKRRKIIPKFTERKETVVNTTPNRVLGRVLDPSRDRDDSAILKYIEERQKVLSSHSTPKSNAEPIKIADNTEFCSAVAEWCESPSQLHSIPNFELPIELSTDITLNNDLDSPDVISSSTQEDRSLYQALLDPYTGSVALRPTRASAPQPHCHRRKIQLPPDEDDRCSVDSVSLSLDSEDEAPPAEKEGADRNDSDDDIKKSKSSLSGSCSSCSDPIPEYSAAEERRHERGYVTVRSGDTSATCDMKVIEPFKRVLSHGGYDERGAAIIVFSACHLPDNRRPDYRYVMDNLFLYVIWTLERLVVEEYVLVYLHGSAAARRLPSFRWLQECYRLIDRRLRKSLKHLYLVHPTFWLKCFVLATKPFVSSKFFRKLSYVVSLGELSRRVPVAANAIPELVRRYDQCRQV